MKSTAGHRPWFRTILTGCVLFILYSAAGYLLVPDLPTETTEKTYTTSQLTSENLAPPAQGEIAANSLQQAASSHQKIQQKTGNVFQQFFVALIPVKNFHLLTPKPLYSCLTGTDIIFPFHSFL